MSELDLSLNAEDIAHLEECLSAKEREAGRDAVMKGSVAMMFCTSEEEANAVKDRTQREVDKASEEKKRLLRKHSLLRTKLMLLLEVLDKESAKDL